MKWLATVLLVACTPTAPGPIAPVIPDATIDAGCATIDKINAARLIRAPDGSALWLPCDSGSTLAP